MAVWFAAPLCGLMSLAGLFGAFIFLRRLQTFRWTQARVTGLLDKPDSEGGYLYVSEFTADWGDGPRSGFDDMEFGWKIHKIGQLIWVGAPQNAEKPTMVWRIWPLFIYLAVAASGLGGLVAIFR